ncbi:MAG TPA: hypothetical protein VF701_04390 [Thermoanaerobaculia bacterium]
MSLPVFIFLAVALPIALLALFWAVARFASWAWLRPRTLAVFEVVFGLFYLIVFWRIEPAASWGLILSTFLGLTIIAQGLYRWFRGQPVRFE